MIDSKTAGPVRANDMAHSYGWQ